jgi:hypothetical protein
MPLQIVKVYIAEYEVDSFFKADRCKKKTFSKFYLGLSFITWNKTQIKSKGKEKPKLAYQS